MGGKKWSLALLPNIAAYDTVCPKCCLTVIQAFCLFRSTQRYRVERVQRRVLTGRTVRVEKPFIRGVGLFLYS